MPTTRPRHTVTEVPQVQDALDALREEQGDERVDVAELVVLGAREKVRRLRRNAPEAAEARQWLAARIRACDLPVDIDAADAAKRHGLIELQRS